MQPNIPMDDDSRNRSDSVSTTIGTLSLNADSDSAKSNDVPSVGSGRRKKAQPRHFTQMTPISMEDFELKLLAQKMGNHYLPGILATGNGVRPQGGGLKIFYTKQIFLT